QWLLPQVTVSPDERWVVAVAPPDVPPIAVPAAGGEPQPIAIHDAIDLIAWDRDPSGFVAQVRRGGSHALVRVALDGTAAATLWSSDREALSSLAASSTSAQIVASVRLLTRQALLLLETR